MRVCVFAFRVRPGVRKNSDKHTCVCVRAGMRVCVRARVRACVRACVRAFVRLFVRNCIRMLVNERLFVRSFVDVYVIG